MDQQQTDSLIQQKKKKDYFVFFAFFFFGMSGLIGWNALISSLDLFDYYHKQYSPSFLIPLISNFVNLGCQFLIIYHKKVFSYKTILVFTMSFNMILIIICPFTVIFIKGLFGFCVTMTFILIQAGINAFGSSTFFSVISYLPKEYIIMFSTGQGASGLIVNTIRYIILFSVKIQDEQKRVITTAIIFFSVSGFLLIITIILLFFVYKNASFKEWMINSGEFEDDKISVILPKDATLYDDNNSNENLSNKQSGKKESETRFDFKRMKDVIMRIIDINLGICFLYMVSYSVYPSLVYDLPLFNIPKKYINNTQTFLYNLSSVTARQLTRLFKIEKKIFLIITCIRVIFIATFPLLLFFDKQKYFSVITLSLLILLSLLLCAGTSGFLATIAYYLGPQNVDDTQKGICGGSLVLFQGIGLVLGSTISSFGMQYLKEYIMNN